MRKTLNISFFLFVFATIANAQGFDLNASIKRGKSIYTKNCVACHMLDGKGLTRVFPPLTKNPNLSDKKRMVHIITYGLKGPIKVSGVPYQGEMTPFKLTDQQTSDVINFVLNSWDNKLGQVLPEEIQPALKTKIKNYTPYKKP
jgi:nitrite reductase (NO-forming)